jgi:acetyl esterase/lipase
VLEDSHDPLNDTNRCVCSTLRSATNDVESTSNAIIYLPPGPIFSDNAINESTMPSSQSANNYGNGPTPQELLARITGSTIITINYRLGYVPKNLLDNNNNNSETRILRQYPTPVHDTLAGFDWVLNTIRPERLGVVGSNVGGSLALMLALTEFQSIMAVAAHEPICDWTGLDEYCTVDPDDIAEVFKKGDAEQDVELELMQAQIGQIKQSSRRKRKIAPPDLVPLLKAREQFFQTPSKYFDPFASPMLLLRSAGKDAPNAFPKYLTGPEYPTPVLQKPIIDENLVDLWDTYVQPDMDEKLSSAEATANDERPTRRRKALSRWPPFGLDFSTDGVLEAKLPWVKIFAHIDEEQAPAPAPTVETDDTKTAPQSDASSRKRRSKAKDALGDSVLASQAKEMVSVMHRACFWGREKGYGEQVVTLSLPRTIPVNDEGSKSNDPQAAAINETGSWFNDVLCRDHDVTE